MIHRKKTAPNPFYKPGGAVDQLLKKNAPRFQQYDSGHFDEPPIIHLFKPDEDDDGLRGNRLGVYSDTFCKRAVLSSVERCTPLVSGKPRRINNQNRLIIASQSIVTRQIMNPSTRGGPHPGAGRKSDTYQADYAHFAHQAMLLGATDANLAAFFRVSERTIIRWKKYHAEFAKALDDGKLIADAKVARTLYERAMGYSYPETQVLYCQGKIINTEIVKHHPPDVNACILWLCNRRPDLWKYPGPINTDEPVTEEFSPQHVPSSSG